MARFVRKFLLLSVLALLVLSPMGAQVDDPAASSYADQFANAFQAGDMATFSQLLQNDPVLARKAFLATLHYVDQNANDQESLAAGYQYLVFFAKSIQQVLGDSGPIQIMAAVDGGNEQVIVQTVTAYEQQVYQQTEASEPTEPTFDKPEYYGQNTSRASDIPPVAMRAVEPLLAKEVRVNLAISYLDPDLVFQEVDTFQQVVTDFENRLSSLGEGVDAAFKQTIEVMKKRLALARTMTAIQFGLLQEFDAQTIESIQTETLASNKLGMYVTALEAALRHQQEGKAREYLGEIESLLASDDEEISPVYRFLAKTAKVRLALLEGEEPSPQSLVRSFEAAWSELNSYRPLYCVNHDTAWTYCKSSVEFWTEELRNSGPEGSGSLQRMYETCLGYLQLFESATTLDNYSGQDLLFHASEIQGSTTFALATTYTALRILEVQPSIAVDSGTTLKEASNTIELITKGMASIEEATEMPLSLQSPGFPPFNLNESAHIVELLVGARYLKTLDPALPNSEVKTLMSSLEPQAQKLARPDAYIGYNIKLGKRYRDLGDNAAAIRVFTRALNKAEQLGYPQESIEAAQLLSEQYGRTDDWANARKYADTASKNLMAELNSINHLTDETLLEQSSKVATVSVKAAVKSNDTAKALEVLSHSQQAKTASLKLSGNKNAVKASKELSKKEKRVESLTKNVEQLKAMPASETRNKLLRKAEATLAEGKAAFLAESRRLREQFSGLYVSTLKFDPLNLPEVQSSLPANVAVLQYFATDDELYIFVVTKSNLKLHQVKVKKTDLNQSVVTYVDQVKKQRRDWLASSQELYKTLLAPVEQDIASTDTLVLIPVGRLNMLPFSSLCNATGTPIMESKTLLSIAKTNDFFKIANSDPVKVSKVVAFANATSNLPAAEQEGQDVVALFPGSQLFVRDEANAENVKKFGSQGDALHLATHGNQDPETPRKNYLSLSNGKLEQGEIFNLPLSKTSMVTLSACNTATDQIHIDKDVNFNSSLAEAFWLAGSRSVMASLWKVEDRATGILMTNFYGKIKEGEGKAKALQLAQQELRKKRQYAHPYFWSGFRFFGDYR